MRAVRRSIRRRAFARLATAGFLLLLPAPSIPAAPAVDSDALWLVVHDLCGSVHRVFGASFPCLDVNGHEGFAVVPNPQSRSEVLLVPTRRISGIESPSLLRLDSPNYWVFAWRARRFVEERAQRTIPRNELGLAINSVVGRSQNQLHIHVNCVRADVRAMLTRYRRSIASRWSRRSLIIAGHPYRVMPLVGAELTVDPFKIIAQDIPGARDQMGQQSIAVLGAVLSRNKPGFYLLAGQVDSPHGDAGYAEELLDPSCPGTSPSSAGNARALRQPP